MCAEGLNYGLMAWSEQVQFLDGRKRPSLQGTRCRLWGDLRNAGPVFPRTGPALGAVGLSFRAHARGFLRPPRSDSLVVSSLLASFQVGRLVQFPLEVLGFALTPAAVTLKHFHYRSFSFGHVCLSLSFYVIPSKLEICFTK